MQLNEIAKILDAAFIFGQEMGNREISRAGASDLMSDILAANSDHTLLLTGLATEQVVRTASIAGVAAVVLIRGKKPSREVADLAKEEELPLLTTTLSMFVASGRLFECGMHGLTNTR